MAGQRLVYPKNLENEQENPAFIQFSFYDRKSSYDAPEPTDIIQLYMPETAANPSTVSWDTEKFGMVGSFMAGKIGPSAGPNVSVNDAVSRMLRTATGNMGAWATQLFGGNASAEGLASDITKTIANPYLTMLFRGVNFRDFQFVFKFTPFQESDCKVIGDIIEAFRSNSLPPGSGAMKGPAFLGYPNECNIEYFWMGKTNPWLPKFKKAVCVMVDTDYTPNGMFSTMRNGFPSQITLTTKWSEIELVLRDDVKEGY